MALTLLVNGQKKAAVETAMEPAPRGLQKKASYELNAGSRSAGSKPEKIVLDEDEL